MPRIPELHLIPANGQQLAVWDWPGADPPLLFAHATGFHGRCWDRIVQRLPGRRCLAVDSRGHGRSSKPAPPAHWRDWGRDLAALAGRLAIRNAVGVGHSMGGHITVQCAALRPDTYRALLLVDPTIFPREQYGTPLPDVSFTLRRKNLWTGPDEMYERFKNRLPFSRWSDGFLRDYCDYGVLPEGDSFVLACPPPIEASIYENSRRPESNIYPEVESVQHLVVVMRAEVTRQPDIFELSASPTSPGLAKAFPNAREVVVAGASHFIPMERPDLVIAEIENLNA